MDQKIIHFLTVRKEFNSLNAKVATSKSIDELILDYKTEKR